MPADVCWPDSTGCERISLFTQSQTLLGSDVVRRGFISRFFIFPLAVLRNDGMAYPLSFPRGNSLGWAHCHLVIICLCLAKAQLESYLDSLVLYFFLNMISPAQRSLPHGRGVGRWWI